MGLLSWLIEPGHQRVARSLSELNIGKSSGVAVIEQRRLWDPIVLLLVAVGSLALIWFGLDEVARLPPWATVFIGLLPVLTVSSAAWAIRRRFALARVGSTVILAEMVGLRPTAERVIAVVAAPVELIHVGGVIRRRFRLEAGGLPNEVFAVHWLERDRLNRIVG